ncbi:hypothetical protein BGZ70_007718 [Mortierella alpina]|uniref:Velvet domain-containing protein n=1 Tax=Mortierella alpina TaxID=64518 RepID=A0A9P6J8F7_MORAP|nr:hypothetical protein BGZ70_007718 [Mortierella alpina]
MGESDKYHYQTWPAFEQEDSDLDTNDLQVILLSYSLEIVQQPLRARMCGFGDKDRRNVTPAPVLKLVAKTSDGRLVSASQLSKQAFVVTADLWHEDEVTERNLVLISSIPSSRTAAYSHQQASSTIVEGLDIQDDTAAASNSSRMNLRNVIHDSGPVAPAPSATAPLSSPVSPPSGRTRPMRMPSSKNTRAFQAKSKASREMHEDEDVVEPEVTAEMEYDELESHRDTDSYEEEYLQELRELERNPDAAASRRQQLSTRNLVGQIAVSGQIAPGLDDDMSHIWFAFSILSIRTEGFFKIRFCLTDIMRIPQGGQSETICQVFSNTIHVQTPKKFEGTCDNNRIAIHLNKNCIRIPARKDEKKQNKNNKSTLA